MINIRKPGPFHANDRMFDSEVLAHKRSPLHPAPLNLSPPPCYHSRMGPQFSPGQEKVCSLIEGSPLAISTEWASPALPSRWAGQLGEGECVWPAHSLRKHARPAEGVSRLLTPQEAERFHIHVPQWELRDEARRIERSFQLRNFREALALVQQVGELAEAEGHHPDIRFGWGYVTVVMQTKKIKGLHENDFIMAAKIDRLFEPAS